MLLKFTKNGIYCPVADVYIDPWRRVKNAIITHGHSDHAKPGHENYLCSIDSKPILRHRLGKVRIQSVDYGKPLDINGVKVSLHPAGHILGSAQVRIEYKGEVSVVSGDYKTEDDRISTAFELVKCHTFITESTFGLPVYKWKPQTEIMSSIHDWWRRNQQNGKVSILCGYSLGKAQRLISLLDPSQGKIYTHGSVEQINDIYRMQGIDLPPTIHVTPDLKKEEFEESIVICPSSAYSTNWIRKFGNTSIAFASGWMSIRGSRRRMALDMGFPLSDHADWVGLNKVIEGTGAEQVYVTHGYSHIFSKWLNDKGIKANVVESEFEGEVDL